MNGWEQETESDDATLWRDIAMNRFGFDELRRIAKFVFAKGGPILKISESKEILAADPEDCLGFAAVARKRSLSNDLIGSLLFLAARRDGAPALAMFAGALADALAADHLPLAPEKPEFPLLRRRVRVLRHAWERLVSANSLLDYRALAVSMDTTAVALRTALDTDEARENPVLQGDFKIVSPTLKQIGHLGPDGKMYLALAHALPVWRAATPVAVLRGRTRTRVCACGGRGRSGGRGGGRCRRVPRAAFGACRWGRGR